MVQGGLFTAHLEALMVVEDLPEINPPSSKVLGGSRRRWSSRVNRVTEDLSGVFTPRAKYKRKEGTGGGLIPRGGSLARSPPSSASWPPGRGATPLRLSFGLREASGLLI